MLISCFQCRQQLDVPDDSAGKRVRCPHCQYVIVAPAKAKTAEPESADGGAAMALPSMELDGENPAPTKVAPLPLPSYDPVPAPPAHAESKGRTSPPIEEYPEMPSIERGGRRRRPPTTPQPGTQMRWGKIIAIGAVVGVIVIGVILGIISSQNNRRQKQPPIVFNQPMPMPMPKGGVQMPPEFKPNVQFGAQLNAGLWQKYQNVEHRFHVQFPGQPGQFVQNINLKMTGFEVAPGNWAFTVAHRTMSKKEFDATALENRFDKQFRDLLDTHGAQWRGNAFNVALAGLHPGREWEFNLPDLRMFFVRTYFVCDGDVCHHYLLMVKAPMGVIRQHGDVDRFFNSFTQIGSNDSERILIEEWDTPGNGGRRDNEFTAFALHPTQPFAITGTAASQVKIQRTTDEARPNENKPIRFEDLIGQPIEFTPKPGKAIEQLAVSPDGQWVAVAAGGEIQCWREWTGKAPLNKTMIPGRRCAFTKNQRLLVAIADEIEEYELNPAKLIKTVSIPDLTIRGFALSADEATLAVHDEKAIEIWNWQTKKPLGRIDAHDAAIMAIAFSPDGKTLASAGVDRMVKLWHVDTRKERAILKQHAWTVAALAFAPDGKNLVSSGLDGMVLLWNLEPAQPQLVWAESHQFPVRAVTFDKDGKHLFLSCKHPSAPGAVPKQYSRQVRKLAWADIKPNMHVAERLVAEKAGLHLPTTSVMSYFTPDGKTFVTTTDGIDNLTKANSLRVWDAATASLRHSHSMHGVGWLSPDGKSFVFTDANRPNQVRILDLATNRVFSALETPANVIISLALFTADSKSVWLQQGFEFVRYEMPNPAAAAPQLVDKGRIGLKNPNNDPRMVVVHPSMDHKTFLVEYRSPDGLLRTQTLHSSADGKVLPLPKAPRGDWSQHLSLRRVWSGQVDLHDLLQGTSEMIGQQRQAIAFDQNTRTYVAAIDPQRKVGATSSFMNDQKVRVNVWDLKERRPLLTLIDPRARSLQSLRFSPDGRFLTMVTGDSWTRIVPTEWLMEHKALLPCLPGDVTGP